MEGRYGEGGEPYEQANELNAMMITPGFIRTFRGTQSMDCKTEVCARPYDEAYSWIHMGMTWHVNGTTKYYLNGTKVFESQFNEGTDGAMPIQPGGVLAAGQEADKPWGTCAHGL